MLNVKKGPSGSREKREVVFHEDILRLGRLIFLQSSVSLH